MKFDATKLFAIAGMALTVAAAIVGQIAGDKQRKEDVAEEVAKQLKEMKS